MFRATPWRYRDCAPFCPLPVHTDERPWGVHWRRAGAQGRGGDSPPWPPQVTSVPRRHRPGVPTSTNGAPRPTRHTDRWIVRGEGAAVCAYTCDWGRKETFTVNTKPTSFGLLCTVIIAHLFHPMIDNIFSTDADTLPYPANEKEEAHIYL